MFSQPQRNTLRQIRDYHQRARRNMAILLFALPFFLASCTNSLVVDTEFPSPIVPQVGITMGVVYDEALKSFTYKEEDKNRDKWVIEAGDAHTRLFDQIFPAMFADVNILENHILENHESGAGNYDLVLYPQIKEFQYSSPKETRIKIYEVWIKYHMQVFNANGDLVADWLMSAYGKTPSAFLQSKEEAMNQAISVALRDLGATLSIGFVKVPEIRTWLEENKPRPVPTNSVSARPKT
ncbi:hypothetical protein [Marinibactrum halimedae]|uniref:Uncharacterized protein n=1 Tax=Marinibactrum halimedae TaxID=1444977 RepID=A0AA37WQ53_9GAMM|nr:hypothetical protein [Marinibactrum halimedae]MCD9458039.1 hypothetical protein [Marinibactrum halimedae]GLS27666.1 hypothetical protein GCM10007877_33850 [Marinibactrum halimedae]